MKIRKVKNASGNTSVQVGFYKGNSFRLIKHIGSAKDPKHLNSLLKEASDFIHTDQTTLFDAPFKDSDLVPMGYTRSTIYKYLSNAFDNIFSEINDSIFKDLVIARIIHPGSKLESLELLYEYFDIKYSKSSIHRHILTLDKNDLVLSLVNYAKKNLAFNFSLLFYDVTTLYFESQRDEILKVPGFSKDGKHTNPQIMIGLIVDKHGFPIYYEIFKGNTFEGHTMIPVINEFKNKFNVNDLTVVADSAMLSEDNLLALEAAGLKYIVGNRTITTYKAKLSKTIERLRKSEGSTARVKEGDRFIIYHFSNKRERKDLYEIQKAVKKAQYLCENPSKRSKAKYLKISADKAQINLDLIEKHKFLAGIKSYKTNINISSTVIVERYCDLWKIEKSFRMSKHDLKARPVFHRKQEAIKAHIQIVFAANAVARHIELNEEKSIKQIIKEKLGIIEVSYRYRNSTQIFSFELTPH